MQDRYDVIVVGARCAGSPTAMLLARAGHRVLLLDRASFPSDTLSTHVITPVGVAALHRWGLLDRVRATGCPPIPTWSFDFGPIRLRGEPPPVEGHSMSYAPRRYVLDALLVDAARAAGVEVHEGVNVEDVVMEQGAAVGVRIRAGAGATRIVRGRVVVGADGRQSRVARTVGAPSTNEKPRLQYAFYSYFEDLPVDGFEVFSRPDRGFAATGTNDGLTMVVVGWPYRDAAAYKSDLAANFLATTDLAPDFGRRVRAARRVEGFLGGSLPGFVRMPFGPGWALVGDASCSRDPITAQGMSDAFLDAELCAAALDSWLRGSVDLDTAMQPWLRVRESRLPLYELTAQLATLEPPPPELSALLSAARGSRPAMDGFAGVVAGTVSPVEYFSPANIRHVLDAAA